MIKVRQFEEKDAEFVQSRNYIQGLQFLYQGDFLRENILTAVDESGNIIGVSAISFHSTWYAKDIDITHMLILDECIDSDNPLGKQAQDMLLSALKEKAKSYKKDFPNEKIAIQEFFEDKEYDRIQRLLENGFIMSGVIPVLAYDLEKEIAHFEIPQGITFERLELSGENVEKYIAATGNANEGVCDSAPELWFRSGDESFQIWCAFDGDKIVSSCTTWNIGEERCATENIFTNPNYRRKNIAREMIAQMLERLKADGKKVATLSMLGTNDKAMKLYTSLGYKLVFNLLEVKYDIK